MKERTIIIVLASVGLGMAAFLSLVLYVVAPMTWRYLKAWQEPHELPIAKIPLEFRTITGQELPKKVDGLRAIFKWSLDPEIFVRFETDAEGIEHVKRCFIMPGGTFEHVDARKLNWMKASSQSMFRDASRWQEKLGIRLFDEKSMESGLLIGSPALEHRCYSVFIDEQRGIVYVFAALL